MKTIKMTANIGVTEGYFHENDNKVAKFNDLYMNVAKVIFDETGIYVSAICKEVATLYNADWGCPKGGEITYELTSTANPEFVQDVEQWKKVVINVVSALKKRLCQSTVTIEFQEVDLIYLTD